MGTILWLLVAPLTVLALALARRGAPGAGVAARELSMVQAVAALEALAHAGAITGLDASDPRNVRMDPVVGGVRYLYLAKPMAGILQHLDARFALLLARLALWSKARFGATGIDTLGIYPGSHVPSAHNNGRALDLAAIVIPGRTWSVLKDWGRKPKVAGDVGFRLPQGDPAAAVFRDLYAFLATQGSDRQTSSGQTAPRTVIGDHGYVLSPDHPDLSLAPAHQDHFHVQIGPTGGPDPASLF